MIDQTFKEIASSLAARTPTPAGGAAAALTASMGTALMLMVIRFTRGKAANADRFIDERLHSVEVDQVVADKLKVKPRGRIIKFANVALGLQPGARGPVTSPSPRNTACCVRGRP